MAILIQLAELNLDAVKTLLTQNVLFIYPPEVIRAGTGVDIGDWRNLVGTGPFELTDWVEGSSITWDKAPGYWGFDEKFPQNRLPYVDTITALVMPEPQTRLAALRSARVDFVGFQGSAQLTSIDQVESLQRTNPDIVVEGYSYRSETSPVVNPNKPPYMTRYEDWPADLKAAYSYNPADAERLLDEAGLPRGADGTRFEMEVISTPTFGDRGRNELLAGGWREIGIDVTISDLEGVEVMARRRAKDFDVRMGVSGYEWNPTGQLLYWTNDPPRRLDDPVYDEMVGRVQAATTLEERQRLSREASDYLNRQHVPIWGARVPPFNAFWPWVKGYNGEADPGDMDRMLIYSRLWIDQDLKREMGF